MAESFFNRSARLTFELPWSASSAARFAEFEMDAWRERAKLQFASEASDVKTEDQFEVDVILGLMRDAERDGLEDSARRIAELYVESFNRAVFDDAGIALGLKHSSMELASHRRCPVRIVASMSAGMAEAVRTLSWTSTNHRMWLRELELDPRNGSYQELIGNVMASWTDAERGAVLRAVIDAKEVESRVAALMETAYTVEDLIDWERYLMASESLRRLKAREVEVTGLQATRP